MNYPTGMNRRRGERGFIALVAVIFLGLMLLSISVEQSLAGWYARFNVISAENKEQANALAEGCADQALARLVADPSFDYSGSLVTVTEQGTCTVEIDTSVAGLATIESQGEVEGSYANLQMTINLSDVHIGDTVITPSNGTLIVQVVVSNDDGGTADVDDFDISVGGGSPSTFEGTDSRAVTIPGGGNYDVDETGPSGYLATFSGDCNDIGEGTADVGQVKSCLVSLNDIPTTITVIANVVNNQGGTSVPSDFQLKIDGNDVTQGVPVSVSPGTHTVSGPGDTAEYAASDWGYECDADGDVTVTTSQQKTCVINYGDNAAPLQCADTFMMLDRTGSMTGPDLIAEREAANALLTLYQTVSPLPKVSFGVFGAPGASVPYSAQVRQTLTTDYSALQIALISGLSSSGGGTNLSSALDVADRELNSSRHVANKEKVIILLSDGDATHPTNASVADSTALTTAGVVKSGSGAAYKHTDNIVTKIFAIHFGASGPEGADMDFLASLGSGGSFDQTIATSYQAPTASSGGAWTTPEGAHAPYGTDAKVASFAGATGATRDYFQFPFSASVPASAIVASTSITVVADASSNFAGASSGCQLGIRLSWDGGTNWTNEQLRTLTSATTTLTFGNTAWTGGHAWSASEIRSSSNFRVRIRDVDSGTSCADLARTSVDYLRVSVGYRDAVKENDDDDYFFVAPTAADMEDVFEDVAKLACPALDPDATVAPTKGTIIVKTHVINDDSGSRDADDFTMTLSSIPAFSGQEAGVSNQINPGSYTVNGSTDSGYTISKDINCSSSVLGALEAGETRTCTVTYDDKTPPPPPPDLNINLGSWQEVP